MESRFVRSQRRPFTEVRYPGDNRLTVYDHSGRDHDETWQLLRGTPWQKFPVEAFMQGDTPIPDLSPAAFHYYMPALLTAALDDSDLGDSLIFFLSPSSAFNEDGPAHTHYDNRKTFQERLALFSPEQREVIVLVLHELAKRWLDERAVAAAVECLS